MKATKRFIESPICYLFSYLLLPAIYTAVSLLVNTVYGVLTINLPEHFKYYSMITEPEEYATCQAVLMMVGMVLTLYLVQKFYFFLDNSRFEYMIVKTEGMYTMPEGLGLYYRSFLIDDIVTCALISAVLYFPALYIPERIMDYGLDLLFYPAEIMRGHLGDVWGFVLLVLIAILTRLVESVSAVKSYRANWLSGSIE